MTFWQDIKGQVQALAPSRRDLRNLGLTFLVVLVLLAAWLWYKDRPAWPWLLGLGVLMGLWGLLWPLGLRLPHRLWMGLAAVLGYFVSRILLSLLYFLVFTPMGLVMRWWGKDLLDLKLGGADSYWQPRPPGEYVSRQTEKMF